MPSSDYTSYKDLRPFVAFSKNTTQVKGDKACVDNLSNTLSSSSLDYLKMKKRPEITAFQKYFKGVCEESGYSYWPAFVKVRAYRKQFKAEIGNQKLERNALHTHQENIRLLIKNALSEQKNT